jgi:S1-C subfamily serine protease
MCTRALKAGLLVGLAVFLTTGPVAAATRLPEPRIDPGQASDAPTAVSRVRPAVIGIRASVPADRPSASTLGTDRWGSGVILDPDGLALTVGYVVLEATRLAVTLGDGRGVPARVVGHDFESGFAAIRLDPAGAPYPVARLGRSAGLAPGERVAAVGMATEGQTLDRAARVTAIGPFVAYWEYMLDRALFLAPLHPAFGGAALVDPDGALVGLVSLRLADEHVAIPIDLWPPVRAALLTDGRPARPPRPWLGVRVVTHPGGVTIGGVSPAGPAHAAGLRTGDVIVRINGGRVADVADFYRQLWAVPVGGDIELTVFRDARLETIRVRPRDRYAVFQFRSP